MIDQAYQSLTCPAEAPAGTAPALPVPRDRRGGAGFTLVEVLIVVTILGIAAAVVVPHMLRPGTLQIQAAGRMVIADLIYAQNEAIAQQSPRRVVFETAGNRYRLTDADGNAVQASWRSGAAGTNDYTVDLGRDTRFAGVSLSAVNLEGGGAVIEYDALGAPSVGGTIDLFAPAPNLRYRITVSPFTGRVTVAPVSGGGS